MLARNVVARIDVDSAGITTVEGVGVGDADARVNEVYAGRVTATPHKYVQGAQYLTVMTSIEDGPGNPRLVSSTFKKEPDGSKFKPTACEAVK